MKAIFLASLVFMMFASGANAALAAGEYSKDTLHVERLVTIENGTSSGKSLSQHTFTKRYYTEADCTSARDVYNAQSVLTVGGRNVAVLTMAKCEAINHSVYQ